jgi:hypothetical protein
MSGMLANHPRSLTRCKSRRLACRAVRSVGISANLAIVADNLCNKTCQFGDRDVVANSDTDRLVCVAAIQQDMAGLCRLSP